MALQGCCLYRVKKIGEERMKNTLGHRSVIKAALITIIVALAVSQMTDAYAHGRSKYRSKEYEKKWAEKYSKKHIKKYHACNRPDCRECKENHHKDKNNKACRKLCSKILPILEAQNVALDEINKKIDQNVTDDSSALECPDSPVAKTGQTDSFATGDDGDLEKGIAWPDPRFTDNGDGTVTDNLTGLIRDRNANRFGIRTWDEALSACNSLAASDNSDLNDGSVAGDWRMANIKELLSLIDFSQSGPALPSGHPFIDVQGTNYWSSTTSANWQDGAWFLDFFDGVVASDSKAGSLGYVWCVRGGQ